MSKHFGKLISEEISSIYLNLNSLKKIQDENKFKDFDDRTKSKIELLKKQIYDSFEKLEKFEGAKFLLEHKTNNILHELEEEFKRLSQKFQRLESFQRQMNQHFTNINSIKTTLQKIDTKELRDSDLSTVKESTEWLHKELTEERKEIFDVEKTLQESEKMISHLKKYLKKED